MNTAGHWLTCQAGRQDPLPRDANYTQLLLWGDVTERNWHRMLQTKGTEVSGAPRRSGTTGFRCRSEGPWGVVPRRLGPVRGVALGESNHGPCLHICVPVWLPGLEY